MVNHLGLYIVNSFVLGITTLTFFMELVSPFQIKITQELISISIMLFILFVQFGVLALIFIAIIHSSNKEDIGETKSDPRGVS